MKATCQDCFEGKRNLKVSVSPRESDAEFDSIRTGGSIGIVLRKMKVYVGIVV